MHMPCFLQPCVSGRPTHVLLGNPHLCTMPVVCSCRSALSRGSATFIATWRSGSLPPALAIASMRVPPVQQDSRDGRSAGSRGDVMCAATCAGLAWAVCCFCCSCRFEGASTRATAMQHVRLLALSVADTPCPPPACCLTVAGLYHEVRAVRILHHPLQCDQAAATGACRRLCRAQRQHLPLQRLPPAAAAEGAAVVGLEDHPSAGAHLFRAVHHRRPALIRAQQQQMDAVQSTGPWSHSQQLRAARPAFKLDAPPTQTPCVRQAPVCSVHRPQHTLPRCQSQLAGSPPFPTLPCTLPLLCLLTCPCV